MGINEWYFSRKSRIDESRGPRHVVDKKGFSRSVQFRLPVLGQGFVCIREPVQQVDEIPVMLESQERHVRRILADLTDDVFQRTCRVVLVQRIVIQMKQIKKVRSRQELDRRQLFNLLTRL